MAENGNNHFGLTPDSEKTHPFFQDYLGQPVHIEVQGGVRALGVLSGFDDDFGRGHLILDPSTTYNPLTERMVIIQGIPTRIALPVSLIRPLPWDLEEFVDMYNSRSDIRGDPNSEPSSLFLPGRDFQVNGGNVTFRE
jgi:hypothetical protein